MEKRKVFETLGIEETKDTNIIKKAYRGKLVQVNPEDDPEGFKLLREAYEEAIRLALINVKEEEELEIQETPITQWIKKVENVYKRLSTRSNVDCWRGLFKEEVCLDFDTSSEARDALLVFLMDNFRLPESVWQLIEDTFELTHSKEELYEKFPVNFVDYITQDAKNKGWLDFTLFEGEDEASIDDFIRLSLDLSKINEKRNYEGAEDIFKKLEEINLYHPYLQSEKIRYFSGANNLEEAKAIADNLWSKNIKDLYIKYYMAELYLKIEDLDKCFELCTSILEVNPNYFGAKVLLGEYYLKKKDYYEAKERYLELIEIDTYDEKLRQGLEKANNGVIESLMEQIHKEPENKSPRLELAWCYYQNCLYDQCIDLFESLEVDSEIYYDYYNLASRAYIEVRNFHKGFPCIEKWLIEILKTEDDGTDKTRRRIDRLGLAYCYMYRCYYHFAEEKENEKDREEALNKCIEYLDKAVEVEKNKSLALQYLSSKAHVLLKLEENKRAVDVCDKILELDKGYYPAYVQRMEAYFNLEMGKEVVDDYFDAIDIYPLGVQPYILATRVYHIYNQLEDAEIVISRAKEVGIESNELKFLDLKTKRLRATTNEEKKEIADELDKLFNAAQKDLGDLQEITDLLHEQALCYYYMDEDQIALDIIEKKLALKKTSLSMVLKGDLLYYLNRCEESIKVYKELLIDEPDYANLWYKIGLCYKHLEREDEALDSFSKTIEMDKEHSHANYDIMEIYEKRYAKTYDKEDYEKAIYYGKKQLEVNKDYYFYNALGLVYLKGYDLEEALEAFEEASKRDDTTLYPYNNMGYVYKILGDMDKAYENYKLAIERTDESNLIAYYNLAKYYRVLGQYDKAIETYNLLAEKNKEIKITIIIIEIYMKMKEWDKAFVESRKLLNFGENGQMQYLLLNGEINALMGNKDEALKFYKKAHRKFPKETLPYIKYAEFLLWIAGKKRRALTSYKLAEIAAKMYNTEGKEEALEGIIQTYKVLKKEKKGAKYLKQLLSLKNQLYVSVENWLKNKEFAKERLFKLALYNFNVGQYEEAKKYMKLMGETLNCAQCPYSGCFEYIELEGKMLELQKDYVGALEKYEKALSIAPSNMRLIYKVNEIKAKIGVKKL